MARQFWKPGNMLYPLPAVMVSCKRKDERPNIITVAWAGTICTNPAMLSISVRPERYSYDIIKETGEFVVNLVTEELVYAADYCGVKSGRNVDKFKEMKLNEAASAKISAPGIEQSPVNIECKVREIKELGSHHLFIADVVSVNIDERYLDGSGRFNLNQSGLAVYSHGEYFGLGRKCGSFGYSVRKNTDIQNTGNKNGVNIQSAGDRKQVKERNSGIKKRVKDRNSGIKKRVKDENSGIKKNIKDKKAGSKRNSKK